MGSTPAGETLPLRRRAMSCAAGLAVAVRALRCCISSASFMEKDPSAGRAPMVVNLTQDEHALGMMTGLRIIWPQQSQDWALNTLLFRHLPECTQDGRSLLGPCALLALLISHVRRILL